MKVTIKTFTDLWLYIKTGYSNYISMPIGLFSTASMIYLTLDTYLDFFSSLFGDYKMFMIIIISIFIPICATLGYVYINVIYKKEMDKLAETSAYYPDAKTLYKSQMIIMKKLELENTEEYRILEKLVNKTN